MKPSERMIEIAKELIKEKGKELDLTKATHLLDIRLETIVRYLDEQYLTNHTGNK